MVLDVVRALGRRWYIVLVGLLLTSGLVYGAYRATPPEYNARALVLLLPPKSDLGNGGNPFLQLSGLEQPASILASYFSSAPAQSDIAKVSDSAEVQVGIDPSTRGPVIAIDVTDKSVDSTMRTLNYLLTAVPAELATLQTEANVRTNAVVTSMQLTVDREPEANLKGTIRLVIATLIIGIVGTGIAAFALDGLLLRRKQTAEETGKIEPAAAPAKKTKRSRGTDVDWGSSGPLDESPVVPTQTTARETASTAGATTRQHT